MQWRERTALQNEQDPKGGVLRERDEGQRGEAGPYHHSKASSSCGVFPGAAPGMVDSHVASCPRQPLADNSDPCRVLKKRPCEGPGVGIIKRRHEFRICWVREGDLPRGTCRWTAQRPQRLSCVLGPGRAAWVGSASALTGPGAGIPRAASILACRAGPGQRHIVEGPSWEAVPMATGRESRSVGNTGTFPYKVSQC